MSTQLSDENARRARSALRQEMRRARRELPEKRRAQADRALSRHIQALGAWRRARSVAVYLAFDGEPSLEGIISAAARQGKQVFAPVLRGAGMRFAPFLPGVRFGRNRFGIMEPAAGAAIDPRALDLVLAPLVAFDAGGARLGMGGGYYDRAFFFLRQRKCWARPKLIGVAYSFQKVAVLQSQPWDVPLWGAVTEEEACLFTGRRQ